MVFIIGKGYIVSYLNTCRNITGLRNVINVITYLAIWRPDGLRFRPTYSYLPACRKFPITDHR